MYVQLSSSKLGNLKISVCSFCKLLPSSVRILLKYQLQIYDTNVPIAIIQTVNHHTSIGTGSRANAGIPWQLCGVDTESINFTPDFLATHLLSDVVPSQQHDLSILDWSQKMLVCSVQSGTYELPKGLQGGRMACASVLL